MDTYGVLSEDVREFLEVHNNRYGYSTDENTLLEVLTEGRVVYRQKTNDTRWWYDEDVVVCIDGRYVAYPWAVSTRDMSAQESGWEMCLDEVGFVRAVEKTIIVYE